MYIHNTASDAYGLSTSNHLFRMTGGNVQCTVESSQTALGSVHNHGLWAEAISLEGGTAVFQALSGDHGYGLYVPGGRVNVTGGTFTFAGAASAVLTYLNTWGLQQPADGVSIYTAEAADGSTRRMWRSAADGRLESYLDVYGYYTTSDFRYVHFGLLPEATDVVLNQARLNGLTPYWANGSTTAQAQLSDWNAYFDWETSTLTLKNAEVNLFASLWDDPAAYSYIQANGDITLELQGNSRVTEKDAYPATASDVIAMNTKGDLTVTGSGALDVQLHTDTAVCLGMNSQKDLFWYGGALAFKGISRLAAAYGLAASGDRLFIDGGKIELYCKGTRVEAVSVPGGEFRLTGGFLDCTGIATVYESLGIGSGTATFAGGMATAQA